MTLNRNFRYGLVVLAPALILGLLGGFARSEPENPDADMNVWAATNADRLPKTLDGLLAHSVRARRAVLRNLSLPEQETIWRAHLEAFVLSDGDRTEAQRETALNLTEMLTDEQRAFLVSTIADLDKYFDPSLTRENRLALATNLCTEIDKVFSREAKATIFANIGGTAPQPASAVTSKAGLLGTLEMQMQSWGIIAPAKSLGNCTCAAQSGCDCTGIGIYCSQTQPPCSLTGSGCGCLGFFDCTGACQLAES